MLNKNGLTPLEKVHPVSPVKNDFSNGVRENSLTGLTLIEVLIAVLITLILFLALMQTALLSISVNTGNVLRDEAVRIAESRMKELRDTPFNSLPAEAGTNTVLRNFRNITDFPFTQTVSITPLPAVSPTVRRIDVSITWEWKEKTVASGNPYTHLISSLKRNPVP